MTSSDPLAQAFVATFQREPTLYARGPGRVNLLGEHVDYNGGLALPCAIDRHAQLAAAPRDDRIVDLIALDLDERCRFSLEDLSSKTAMEGGALPKWARYAAGVAWSLDAEGIRITGLDGILTSSVPNGAGLSSSAAIETCLATGWLALANHDLPPLRLARACQRAENEYVGVASGLMDQWTSIAGRSDHALKLDFTELTAEPVWLPHAYAIVVADSRQRRSLENSPYNQRVEECREAERILSERSGAPVSLGTLTGDQFESLAGQLPEPLFRRARHVVTEVERVRQAVHALRSGQPDRLGSLMLEGHTSLRDDFQVSTPRLDLLVELAAALPGCFGARLTGAGFGGCTVNWVRADAAPAFGQRLAQAYQRETGVEPRVWVCRASDGAEAFSRRSP